MLLGNQKPIEDERVDELIEELIMLTISPIASQDAGKQYKRLMATLERKLVIHALVACKGNKSRAARRLGINRNSLRKPVSVYGITSKMIAELCMHRQKYVTAEVQAMKSKQNLFAVKGKMSNKKHASAIIQ